MSIPTPGLPVAVLLTGAALFVTSCGGGGGPSAPSGSGGTTSFPLGGRDLRIVAANPGDRAVQIPIDASLEVEFDGRVAPECLSSALTGLFVARSGEPIPTQTALSQDGHRVRFVTLGALAVETDHELRFDPLTCDIDGRVLDETVILTFRTIDETPPRIVDHGFSAGAHPILVDRPLLLHANEELEAASVTPDTVALRDTSGRVQPTDLEVDGSTIRLRPVRDLPGAHDWIVSVRGVRDRSGNRATESWSERIRTPDDLAGPRLVSTWPSPGAAISPLVGPELRFDETLLLGDSGSPFRWSSVEQQDVPHDVVVSRDGRTLWLVPRTALVPGSTSTIVISSEAVPTDLSGNRIEPLSELSFAASSDRAPPQVTRVAPPRGDDHVPVYVWPTIAFDEPLDPVSIRATAFALFDLDSDGLRVPVRAVDLDAGSRSVTVVPAGELTPATRYELRVEAGLDSIRDVAGNRLGAPLAVAFSTNSVLPEPTLTFWPAPNAIGVAVDASLVIAADVPLDPSTVDATTVLVTDGGSLPVAGRLELTSGDRVVRFKPTAPWRGGGTFAVRILGGADGLRAANGNWMRSDASSSFRAGFRTDANPPRALVAIEGITSARALDRATPRQGFSIEVSPLEGIDPTFDPTSVRLEVVAGGSTITSDALIADVRFTQGALRLTIAPGRELPPGRAVARATASDLSGNTSAVAELAFEVDDPSAAMLPFERTQVVWVRFDLDRNGNGRGDFVDDLIRVGLCAEGDPLGRNERMFAIVRDGVLAQCRSLYGRRPTGGPLGPDSIPIRITHAEPLGVAHMEIACGGFDPEGSPSRRYGDASTGTLGRAWYDYRNAIVNDRNTALDPGLGVFPAELWLFECRVHQQVYPSVITSFARRFLGLAPDLGGTPAGMHRVDSRILDPAFDFTASTGAERARWESVFAAADDWATAVGIVLAHEVGHTVGLTAPGTDRAGLHGDASLHNAAANTTDVMAAAIGFDALVNLEFSFRDLNRAYLRQRVILR